MFIYSQLQKSTAFSSMYWIFITSLRYFCLLILSLFIRGYFPVLFVMCYTAWIRFHFLMAKTPWLSLLDLHSLFQWQTLFHQINTTIRVGFLFIHTQETTALRDALLTIMLKLIKFSTIPAPGILRPETYNSLSQYLCVLPNFLLLNHSYLDSGISRNRMRQYSISVVSLSSPSKVIPGLLMV